MLLHALPFKKMYAQQILLYRLVETRLNNRFSVRYTSLPSVGGSFEPEESHISHLRPTYRY